MRKLDDWLDAYMDYTEETEPRPLFRQWCGISAIASCLRRKCFISLGREVFYPNLYIVLVGPPAARKGTAMKPAVDLIDSIGIQKAADESSRQKLILRLKNANYQETDADNNIYFHSSLTIISSELTVFLGYGNLELITYLCDWFDCKSTFTYDTIGRGEDQVVNVWVNLLGATTPAAIRASLPIDAIGTGLVSRTIFVYEGNKAKVVVFPQEMFPLQKKLKADLEAIGMMRGQWKMDEEFMEAYTSFRYDNEAKPPFKQFELLGYNDRRQVHLIKLALIYSASRGEDQVVRRCDFDRAYNLLQQTEKNMPMVFQGLGRSPLADVQVRIMEFIATHKETTVAVLLENFLNDLTMSQLNDVLTALQQMNYCYLHLPEGKITFNEDILRRHQ